MKLIYNNITIILVLITNSLLGQNIQFTIENANNTFDGQDWWYNADVFIQAIDGQADFKLGSGQLYLNYNTAAFGENVFDGQNQSTDNFDFLQPTGSVLNQNNTSGNPIYGFFIPLNNTPSRVSLFFEQITSSGAFTENVTSTAQHLLSFRFRYVDSNKPSNISFETNISQARDQFYTACGPDNQTSSPDCTNFPGTQFVGASFDSSNAADTMVPVITLTGDNPQEIIINDPYNELGATSDDGGNVVIDASQVDTSIPGIYEVLYDITDFAGNMANQVIRTVNVVDQTLSINDLTTSENSISIYPNPMANKLFVSDNVNKVNLYDLTGTLILTSEEKVVDVSSLASAMYLVEVFTTKGSEMIKVLKE